MNERITPRQVMERYNVGNTILRRWIKNGAGNGGVKLPVYRKGKRGDRLFDPADIERCLLAETMAYDGITIVDMLSHQPTKSMAMERIRAAQERKNQRKARPRDRKDDEEDMDANDYDRRRSIREVVRIRGVGESALRTAIREGRCRSVAVREGSSHRRTTLRWVDEWQGAVAGKGEQPKRSPRKPPMRTVSWADIEARAYAR